MNKELKVFKNEEFGSVRTTMIDGEPWFVGKDVAGILGYQNGNRDICRHVAEEDRFMADEKLNTKTVSNFNYKELGQRGGWLINESGLYALILSSKLPSAKKFKHWITSEVLPTIRKTGGYVADDDLFINTYLPDADERTRLMLRATLTAMKDLSKTVASQNEKLETQKPLVEFADRVSNTAGLIDMSEMAKLLHDRNIPIGRNKLFRWLRDSGVLRKNNEPYQKYIENGYFKVREYLIKSSDGDKVCTQTYVTGKGQLWIAKKLSEEYLGLMREAC